MTTSAQRKCWYNRIDLAYNLLGIISEKPNSKLAIIFCMFHFSLSVHPLGKTVQTQQEIDCSMVEIYLDFTGCLDLLSLVEIGRSKLTLMGERCMLFC